MAAREDDSDSEQALENILETTNAIWENASGITKDKIILPGNRTHQRIHTYAQPIFKAWDVM